MNRQQYIKLGLGCLVFLFSIGLAYFSAKIFNDATGVHSTAYWVTLLLYGGVYTMIGMFVSSVLPVALGLLLSSSILFGHTLFDNYDKFNSEIKMLVTGIILAILYAIAFKKFADTVLVENRPTETAPINNPIQ